MPSGKTAAKVPGPRGPRRSRPTARIITGKVTPPQIPPAVVARPRVEKQLSELIRDHHIVCVYATAGAGKTTAVRQAVRSLRRPLCWLSVDATDVATGRLLTYLEAALVTQVTAVAGVTSAALATRLPHAEVAALLAEAIGTAPVVLVIDDLERLAGSSEAVSVLEAFLRYIPPTARVVLISRNELPFAATGAAPGPWLTGLGEDDLAFTVNEAAAALARTDRPDVDPAHAIAVTGGWVTGVLFEAWRAAEHATGLGGEADPLHGYLAAQILDQLTPAEREFLICTALLDEVTPAAAEALGLPDAAARLHALRARHLPASWDCHRSRLRCHPRFREYLLTCLQRRDDRERHRLYRAHGQLLLHQGHPEEAVEAFLQANALDDALTVAEQTLETLVERADFTMAERWLQCLQPVRRDEHIALDSAELMLALGSENYRRGVAIADRLAATNRRDMLARSSSKLASMMAWCYLHAGRLEDILQVIAVGCPGVELDAMRYCMALLDDVDEDGLATVPLSGGPLDALIMRVHYYFGRLPLLLDPPVSPWAAKAAESWRLGALLAMGHVEQAAALYRAICEIGDPGAWLTALFHVELLRELGQPDAAWRALLKGRERLRASGSLMLEMLSYVEEAALDLRFNHDSASARAALETVRSHPVGRVYAFIAEQAATWLGCALLRDGEDKAALDCLATAVTSMRRGGRILLLPVAAIYLAEAHWRTGDATRADEATDWALTAAEEQGSNHLLLGALADFPMVLSRRLDAEVSSDSPWHGIGRALMARGVQLSTPVAPHVHLGEFGRTAITVNGAESQPRIKKSYELLAFLANHDRHEATREELLQALFEGRHDDAAAAYLRQAVRKLREVLPADTIEADPGQLRLRSEVTLTSDSSRFRCLLAQAASLRGRDRLAMLLQALQVVEAGTYLPGIDSTWVEQRRHQFAVLALDARGQAAELAFADGDYRQAMDLVEAVLTDDPFRESVWRLAMRIADATGDGDRVIAAYRSCEQTLRQLGTNPSATTRRLLDDLRK